MNPSSSASSAGDDTPTNHLVELTSSTLQVVRVEAGAIGMSRNAALDNKASLDLLLNEVSADWQTSGWSAGIGGFLPATSWHIVTEEQVRSAGAAPTLGAVATGLSHGFAGDLLVAGCSAGKGAPVESAGENRWLVAVAPKEGLDKLLAGAERGKLTPSPVGPGVLDHIGAISRLLRVTGQSSVALWELGLERSHFFLVTANGVEAVVPCEIKLTDVWEAVRTELNLKYQLAAARLFYGDLFDFTDAAPRVAGALSGQLSSAFNALPVHGDKPALACAGLTGTQNWLVNHLAASLGTTNWQPDPETALGEFGLHVGGDILPGQLAPATFGLLHRASVSSKGGNAWKPVWHALAAADFKFALSAAPKPALAPVKPVVQAPAPKPVVPTPAPAPKPAPIPTPIPAPKPAIKAPTPMPRPAQPTPVAKPAQLAPAPAPKPAQVILPPAKPAQPAPQPTRPVVQAPAKPAPQPAKPAPQPAPKPAETPKPAAAPAPQPAAKSPLAAAAANKAAGQPAAKKKAPVALFAAIGAAVVIGAVAFFFIQSSNAKAEQARLENERVVAKAKAEAEAAKKAAEEASAKQRAAAEAEIARLRAEAAKSEKLARDEAAKRLTAQETLARTPGVISITTIPEGAEVSIDGSTPQITPATITNVTPGMRKVVVSMPGYDTVTQLVEIKGAQILDLGIVSLQSILGTLMLRSEPADAEYAVFPAENLDGAPLRTGRTPGSVDKLPPGEYVIKFARPGLVPTSEHATIAGKEVVNVSSTFIVGGVSLTSTPSGAAVKMNGEYLGVTPLVRPELTPGNASFEFTLPDHEPVKRTGEITNKETLRLHAEMLNVERIAKASEVKSPPKILQSASPIIPPNLGEVKGDVVISVVITRQGTIRDIRVDKSTNPALTEPCLKAVTQWKFSPAISKAGMPVNMRLSIPFKFDVKPVDQRSEEEISSLPPHMR